MKRKFTLMALLALVGLATHAQTISTVAGGSSSGSSGDNGPAASALLNNPTDVAFDAAGNMYIVDQYNNEIRKVSTSGTITTVIGSLATGYTYSGDNGPASAAGLSGPNYLCVDASGNIYFSDNGNNVVRKVSTSGTITTVAGDGNYGSAGNNGPATSAEFAGPSGIAFDAAGNMYIADQFNNVVRKVSTAGIITTVAGTGAIGFSGDNGAATSAKLNGPTDVAFDAAGNMYIADGYNCVVRKVNTSGTITTVVGNHSLAYGYSGDNGPAVSAGFSVITSIMLDAAGNMIVTDQGNNVIRRVNTSGVVTTIAGNGSSGFSGDNGLAVVAQLSSPGGVAMDALGNMFIADAGNNRIRKVSSNAILPPCAGQPTAAGFTASVTAGCNTYSSVLTANIPTTSGLAYQWQSSPDSLTWTNISGATGAAYTASVSATTYYRLLTICTNSNDTAASAGTRLLTLVETASTATLPYFQGFEDWSDGICFVSGQPDSTWKLLPNGGESSWRREDQGALAGWSVPSLGAYTPASSEGAHSAAFHSPYATNTGHMDLHIDLSTPGTKHILFDYINQDSTSGGNLTVLIDTSGTGLNFSTLGQYNAAMQWTPESILTNLTTATSTASIIRFQAILPNGWAAKNIGIDSLSISVLAPCNAVTGLAATSIGTDSAIISWTSSGAAGYQVVVDQTPADPAVPGTALTATSYHATGLSGGATYYVHVLSDCGPGYTSSWTTLSFATLPVCDPVTGLAASNVTSSGAILTWNAVSGSAGYEVIVTTANTPASSIAHTNTVVYSPFNLSSNTTYHVFVRDSCGSNNFSAWATLSFTTASLGVASLNGDDRLGMTAYPNPVKNVVTVSISGHRGNKGTISLTDITGRELRRMTMTTDKAAFEMSGLSAGIYLIRYEDEEDKQTIRVSKQ